MSIKEPTPTQRIAMSEWMDGTVATHNVLYKSLEQVYDVLVEDMTGVLDGDPEAVTEYKQQLVAALLEPATDYVTRMDFEIFDVEYSLVVVEIA